MKIKFSYGPGKDEFKITVDEYEVSHLNSNDGPKCRQEVEELVRKIASITNSIIEEVWVK